MGLAHDFWSAVGRPVIDFEELQIGEVFLIESADGRWKHAAQVVSRNGDEFACRNVSMDELGENYKVWVRGE